MKYHGFFFLKSCPICIFGSISCGDKLHSVLCDSFVSRSHPSLNVRSHVFISNLQVKWEVTTLRNARTKWGWAEEEIRCKAFLFTITRQRSGNGLCFGPMITPAETTVLTGLFPLSLQNSWTPGILGKVLSLN